MTKYKKKSKSGKKKNLKQRFETIDKKTDWAIPFYFQFIHALGLFAGAILLSVLVGVIFSLNYEASYIYIVFLVFYALLIFFSWHLGKVKYFIKGVIISSIILLVIYFGTKLWVNY